MMVNLLMGRGSNWFLWQTRNMQRKSHSVSTRVALVLAGLGLTQACASNHPQVKIGAPENPKTVSVQPPAKARSLKSFANGMFPRYSPLAVIRTELGRGITVTYDITVRNPGGASQFAFYIHSAVDGSDKAIRYFANGKATGTYKTDFTIDRFIVKPISSSTNRRLALQLEVTLP